MKNVRKETNARGKIWIWDFRQSVQCPCKRSNKQCHLCISASKREASITSIGSRNPGERERTVPSSSGSGVVAVVALVHETGEKKSAMELEALVMANQYFHPHKLYKLYKFIGKE